MDEEDGLDAMSVRDVGEMTRAEQLLGELRSVIGVLPDNVSTASLRERAGLFWMAEAVAASHKKHLPRMWIERGLELMASENLNVAQRAHAEMGKFLGLTGTVPQVVVRPKVPPRQSDGFPPPTKDMVRDVPIETFEVVGMDE